MSINRHAEEDLTQIFETIPQGVPSAITAAMAAAVPIHDDELFIVIRVAGNEISAYAKGATDPVRLYGAMSLIQKLGYVSNS